mmetsp:Transcript_31511/g.72158  ORF Transcript_31511/g.72158 Transcript_31511/m.72158 type:complete len:124 (+) Transcript_31511:234-605(+)
MCRNRQTGRQGTKATYFYSCSGQVFSCVYQRKLHKWHAGSGGEKGGGLERMALQYMSTAFVPLCPPASFFVSCLPRGEFGGFWSAGEVDSEGLGGLLDLPDARGGNRWRSPSYDGGQSLWCIG